MSTPALMTNSLLPASAAAPAGSDAATGLDLAALRARVQHFARGLAAAGLQPGATLALRLRAPIDRVAATLAILEAGAVAWPLEVETPDVAGTLLDTLGPQGLLLDTDGDALAWTGPRLWLSGETLTASGPLTPAALAPGPALLLALERPALRLRAVALPLAALAHLSTFLRETLALDLTHTVIHDVAPALALPLACAAVAQGGRVSFEPLEAPGTSAATCVALPLGALEANAEHGFQDTAWMRPGLRHLLSAGEHEFDARALKTALRDAGCTWHNFYGLPEVPLVTTLAAEVVAGARGFHHVGRPIAQVEPYVLDDARQPAAAGRPAQLHLGGAWQPSAAWGVPAGVQPNPFRAGQTLWHSGWRALWRPDGRLVALGRPDGSAPFGQGRLDLPALAAACAGDDGASEAVVVVRPGFDGRPRLSAFVAGRVPERVDLARLLPPWALPVGIVQVDALPRTSAGRLDGERLLAAGCFDDLELPLIERGLASASGVDVAVLVEPEAPALGRWHLDDVLPQRALHGTPSSTGADAPPAAELAPALVPDPPPALAHGPAFATGALPATLTAALAASGRIHERGVHLLRPGSAPRGRSYAELWQQAGRVHAGLVALGCQPGDKVLLQLDAESDFLGALWGCLHGGYVPVPLAIPPTYAGASQPGDMLVHVHLRLGRPLLVTSQAQAEPLRAFLTGGGEVARVAAIETLRETPACEPFANSQPEDVALLLFTSGSTGQPKGVQLSQANLLAHACALRQAFAVGPQDVTLNWMPLEHVGALVMFHLRDALLGAQQYHARTADVLGDPLRWLEWLDDLRVSVTWAPNFAYALLNDRAAALAERRFDLRHVRLIMNGGEAVNARTVQTLLDNLAPFGLPASAMVPCWGMSETSSALAMSPGWGVPGVEPFSAVDPRSLAGGLRRLPVEKNGLALVSVGPPLPGATLRIVDAHDGLLPEGHVGRVQVRGPQITRGYHDNPQVNAEVLRADGFFDTGDLGFLAQGRLTLTGRAKDLIIVNGLNYNNNEIETLVEEVAGVEPSFTAACAVSEPGRDTERLAIFFNSRHDTPAALTTQLRAIQQHVTRGVGLRPELLIPVAQARVPKTAIGKIQRAQLARDLRAGAFAAELRQSDLLLGNENTLPAWFQRPLWRRAEATPARLAPGPLVVLGSGAGLAQALAAEARRHGRELRLLESLNPRALDGVAAVVDLRSCVATPAYDFDAPMLIAAQERWRAALVELLRALPASRPARWLVVTRQAALLPDERACDLRYAGLTGALATAGLEHPGLRCAVLDLGVESPEQGARDLWNELHAAGTPRAVAYREGGRFVSALAPVQAEPLATGEAAPVIGLQLITGALGGVGQRLSESLLRQPGVRLLLLGRRTLDDTRAARAYQQLERVAGPERVRYAAGDVGDAEFVRQAVAQAEAHWRQPLAGVFHLAGSLLPQGQEPADYWRDLDAHRLEREQSEVWEAVSQAKLRGTWTLHELLAERGDLPFACASSVNGIFGGAGLGAYAAANAFVDNLALWRVARGARHTHALGFSQWEDVGLSGSIPRELRAASAAGGFLPMTPGEALHSLLLALRLEPGVLSIGLDPSHARSRAVQSDSQPRQAVRVAFASPERGLVASAAARLLGGQATLVELPALPRDPEGQLDRVALRRLAAGARIEELQPEPPDTASERAIHALWRELLGQPRFGVEDSFFSLGGHSLLATQLVSRLEQAFGVDVPLQVLFGAPTVRALAAHVDRTRAARRRPALVPQPPQAHAPLSYAQQRLWFLERLTPGTGTYNISGALRVSGALDVAALWRSLEAIQARHEALRTVLPHVDGVPYQHVEEHLPFERGFDDWSARAPVAAAEWERWARAEAARPFDLDRGPLLRAALLRLASDEHLLVLSVHHAVADGWSIAVLQRELFTFYEAERGGRPAALPALPVQYRDYAAWQRSFMPDLLTGEAGRYWQEHLRGPLPVLELPSDRPRQALAAGLGDVHFAALPGRLALRLEHLAQTAGCTLFMALLAAFDVLLQQHTGQDDLIVGTPVAGRNDVALEGLIGFFVNTVAVRTTLSNQASFREVLRHVRVACLGAYEHQEVPFEHLVEMLQPERRNDRTPLVQVMFALQNAPAAVTALGGLRVEPLALHTGTSKFELTFSLERTSEELLLAAEYRSDLFDAASIAALCARYQRVIEAVLEQPDAALDSLDLLPANERRQLLAWSHGAAHDYPGAQSVPEVFAQVAARHANAVAVVAGHETLTYAQLERDANRVAWALASRGVRPGARVGVCLERSPATLASLLGILKAGAAYVPLEHSYPRERLALLIRDAGLQALVTRRAEADVLPESPLPRLVLDEDAAWIASLPSAAPPLRVGADDLAYVTYTSGSTGLPKGVEVLHRGVLRLTRGADYVDLDEHQVLLHLAPLAFDASTFEIWGALLNGARVVLYPERVPTAAELGRVLADGGVTTLWLTAALFNTLVDEDPRIFASVRQLLTGGEALSPVHVRRALAALPDLRLVNGYGPTESTTFACCHTVPAELAAEALAVPIGRPIANTTAFVLDRAGRLAPRGVIGELYLGGAGLARGYLERPALTAERFVAHPLAGPGQRLYRTGDLVRWRADGLLDFIGRNDGQVKLRGFRIELGEIEQALLRQAGVRQAVVLARPTAGGERRLVAWVVGAAGLSSASLRAGLAASLPEYMLPAACVLVEHLPLTTHGKIDTAALPDPAPELIGSSGARPHAAAPVKPDEIDDVLALIWRDVLGPVELDRERSFFEQGGHSLKATQVLARVHRACGVEVRVQDFFDDPTLAGLARAVRTGAASACAPIPRVAEQADYELSNAQRRLWILDQFEEDSNAYNIYNAVRLVGALDVRAFEAALGDVVARHESLRTVFVTVDGQPRQRVLAAFTPQVRLVDLCAHEAPEAEARRLVLDDANTEFDLVHGPVLRATLFWLDERTHVLSFIVHHIVADGWSMGLLFNELVLSYNARRAGHPAALPSLALQYRDYAAWQNLRLSDRATARQRDYWLAQLTGAPRGVELPLDRPRPAIQTFNGRLVTRVLPSELVAGVLRLAARTNTTPFMVFLGSLYVLLYRYSGQADLTIGSPIAGRQHRDLDELVGFFVNTLVLRARLEPGRDFEALLAQVKRVTLEAYEHQSYPFDRIVEDLGLERDLSRTPLFNVMLAFNNTDTLDRGRGLEDVEIEPYPLDDVNMAKFDLTVFLDRLGDSYLARFEYNSDLFDGASVERLLDNYATLLEALGADDGRALQALPLVHARERALVLSVFNDTARPSAELQLLQVLFERQVRRTPESTAVVCDGQRLSYSALNARANRLAHVLRARGVRPGDLVGLTVERSFDLPVAVLGILKAGAGYVAVDPTYPAARVQHMLADSRTELLVTDRPRPDILAEYGGQVLALSTSAAALQAAPDFDPEACTALGDTAYVVYTSGSTGVPNGARLAHDVLANLLAWQREVAGIDGSGRCLQFTSLNFCVSFQEIFGTLTAGGELHMIGELERQDVDYLIDFLGRQRINLLYLPFSYLNFLFQESQRFGAGFHHELRDIVTAGEQLKITPGMQAFLANHPHVRLHNHYGSSEMHVVTAFTVCAAAGDYPLVPPAGRPIANTRAAILDPCGQPVPIGVFGELYFSCAGHMPGYVHNPELTARKFVDLELPDGHAGRYYRTGDVGRWRADGNIEYKGRLDAQHKIRGFRVELGEVESALLALPGVEECVVDVRLDAAAQKYLAAYVVLDPERLEVTAVRHALKARLPQYMLPTLVPLERLPLMPNGKVDRERLPDPASLGLSSGSEYVPPRDDLERRLVAKWAEFLGVERVGVRDNFFDLGGQSLKATQLVAWVERELGASVRLSSFFQHATVEELAQLVRGQLDAGATTIVQPLSAAARAAVAAEPVRLPEQDHYALSHAQRRLWLFDRLHPGSGAYNSYNTVQLEGELRVEALQAALAALIARHETLRTVFPSVVGEPRQRVLPVLTTPLRFVDLEHHPDASAEAHRLVLNEAETGFDLTHGPLLRATLVRAGARTHVLSLVVHHIATDGWSMALLLGEFALLYRAHCEGREAPLPTLPLAYRDFAAWHNEQVAGPSSTAARAFWLAQLADAPPGIALPYDHARPASARFGGRRVARILTPAATRALAGTATETGTTPFMVFLAAWCLFLNRLSGQSDLVLGAPSAGRNHPALEGLVGFFVNTFLLRVRLDPQASVRALLAGVRATCLATFPHRDYPFDLVSTDVAASAPTRRAPTFNVMLAFSDTPADARIAALPDLSITRYALDEVDLAKFDLTLFVDRLDEGQLIRLEFDRQLFEGATIERWADAFVDLLQALPTRLEQPAASLTADWDSLPSAPAGGLPAVPTPRDDVAPASSAGAPAAALDDDVQRRLAVIWCEVLGVARAQPQDDFFAVGGHSLRLIPLAGRIAREFDVELPLGTFLARPTLGALAHLLRSGSAQAGARGALAVLGPASAPGSALTPFFCVHGAGGAALAFRELAGQLGDEQPFYGLQAPGLDTGRVEYPTLQALAADYVRSVRAIQPHGPYQLGGWSMGGVVAQAMACELVAQGEEVGALVIVDALASAPAGWSGSIDEALLLQGFAVEQGVVLDPERPQALFEGEGGTSLRGLFEVYSRHVRLMLEHTPASYPGALLLLHAAGSPTGDDGAMGWSRFALRGCTVRELSGTHHGVLHAPHVASLAREIAAWLRQASQAGGVRVGAPERRERS